MQAFSVETAGTLDLDAELDLWFSGPGEVRLEFGGRADTRQLGQLIASRVLWTGHRGGETASPVDPGRVLLAGALRDSRRIPLHEPSAHPLPVWKAEHYACHHGKPPGPHRRR